MSWPMCLRDITVGYRGHGAVLRDATLAVRPGSITGLLGRNGAGKTTLIHAALGLKKAWHGRATLFGQTAWHAPAEVRRRVGFVPQHFDDFHWLTVSQCVALVGGFYDAWDDELVADLQARWDLEDARIGSLSPGLRQRVGVLLAIGHRPDLLVLDEPVASLDPGARRDFLRLLGDLNAGSSQTILLSSHICSDIERICSDVAILHDGRIVVHSGLDELKDGLRGVHGLPEGSLGDDVVASSGDRVWLRNWQMHDLSAAARIDELTLEEFFLDVTS